MQTLDEIKKNVDHPAHYGGADKGYCYGTINNYKGILRPAFELACDDKILSRNPFSFRLSKVVPKENKTKTILSNE